MAITAADVKELRDKTGAGMADCKRALEESNGDTQAAVEWLRKRGAASMAKRADRQAKEGVVVTLTTPDCKTASIIELNCETDFVARNEDFVAFANAIAQCVLDNPVKTEDDVWALSYNGTPLKNMRDEILAKFSEKIELSRFEHVTTSGYLTDYVHMGSRLGVLVEFAPAISNDNAKPLSRDIAMQVAAMAPGFVERSQVNTDVLAKELEIYKQQAMEEGKKEDIAERIAQGRLGKFYEENVLVEQTFIKDSAKKVSDVVAEIGKLEGSTISVVSFRRYNVGESV